MTPYNFLPNHGGGIYLSEDQSVEGMNLPFWAKLTAYDGSKYYSWNAVVWDIDTGTFIDLPGGNSGTYSLCPAFEPNGASITLPAYCQLQYAYFDPNLDWTFVITGLVGSGGTGSLEMMDVSGTPDITGVVLIIVNSTDFDGSSDTALLLKDKTGGGNPTSTVQVSAYYATPLQDGVVSTTAQSFGGNKEFVDGWISDNDTLIRNSTAPVLQFSDFTSLLDTRLITDTLLGSSDWLVTLVGLAAPGGQLDFRLEGGTSNVYFDVSQLAGTIVDVAFSVQGNRGKSTTINYTKSDSSPGTLVFKGGILIGYT